MSDEKQAVEFELEGAYIELIQLLKMLNIASSGGEAKMMVSEGLVMVNGETEFRKRNKLKVGDVVVFEDVQVKIV